MSCDLAVREGERPADDKITGQVFSDLYDRYSDSEGAMRTAPRCWPR